MTRSTKRERGPVARAALAFLVALSASAALVLFTRGAGGAPATGPSSSAGAVDDRRIANAAADEPGSWLSYGQSYEEQRFSTLDQIDRSTVGRLGLAWWKPMGGRHRLQATPLVVDGVMYVTTSWNVIYALDARTGQELWSYDPATDREFVRYSCCGGPINRGVAVYRGLVYEGTYDGRLVAVNAATGKLEWEVDTYHPSARSRFNITGAPRVAAGKVFIGQSSSEFGVRGYVSAYDAATGELSWRFYLVPGDPSLPFEHPELEAAAKTWSGEWWKYGGGGTVWNSIIYDPDLHTLYLGVGNGAPWPRRIRSPGGGDNHFLTSIVAVDPDTGRMKWQYQTVPGDNWDYSAAMDLMLADLVVDGTPRKVLLQAPKNGFFYVLDRTDGKPLRAHPFTDGITWATHIDLTTGRPVENPAVVYEERPQWILPGNGGAHNWHPMSLDEARGIVYLSVHDNAFFYALPEEFVRDGTFEMRRVGMTLGVADGPYRAAQVAQAPPEPPHRAWLKAFEPLSGRTLWSVETATTYPSGVLATAGGIVLHGDGGTLSAHDAATGARLWQFDTKGSIQAAPITYRIDDTQYVAVTTGPHRDFLDGGKLVVFALDANERLPQPRPRDTSIPPLPPLVASASDLTRGDALYHELCADCHGGISRAAIVGTATSDLRRMSADSHRAFPAIVLDGTRRALGMRGFAGQLAPEDAERIHQYLIAEAGKLQAAAATRAPAAEPPAVTAEMFDRWMSELGNWGRWGKDDQLGAINLITSEKRKAAAALVRDGVSVSLAHDLLTEQAPDNPSPFEHTMTGPATSAWAVDRLGVSYHGFAHTHMDGLCHVSYQGRYYNGVPRSEATEEGCSRLGISVLEGGILTRGVLIDIPWLKGVDALEPGTPVTREDLEAWERKTGVVIEPGDALLLRTGRWARRAAKGAWSARDGFAGFHASAIPWLKERDPAIVGSDAALDVMPSGLVGGDGISPIHMFVLVALGANVLDNGDFEELAAEAKARGRWDFLLSFAPLRVVGGTGSPLNPIATF